MIDVPPGGNRLIAFSRPYFCGYRAWINGRALPVRSIRNLIPLVEIPRGARGNIVLAYRPSWLIYGGAVAIGSGPVWIVSAILALRSTNRA